MKIIIQIVVLLSSELMFAQCIQNVSVFSKKYLYKSQLDYPYCGAIDEKDSSGNTLLLKATLAGNATLIEWLLKNGANPEIKNRMGSTAFDDITFSHVGEPCKTPDCSGSKDIWVKNDKRVSEILSIFYKHSKAKDSLITMAALITAIKHRDYESNKKTYALLAGRKLYLNYTDTLGNSLLHLAVIHQNYSTTIWLIRMGMDKKLKNISGYTAIEILGNEKKPFLEELKRELEK